MAKNSIPKLKKATDEAFPVDMVDSIVRPLDANGNDKGLAHVVAYYDAPTFLLCGPDGVRYVWAADLCKGVTDLDSARYWRARATPLPQKAKPLPGTPGGG